MEDKVHSDSEKRVLAEMPGSALFFDDFASFRRAFESYFGDHLGLRSSAINAYSTIKVRAFNVSPSDRALLGKDRWIYYWAQSRLKLFPEDDFQGYYKYPLSTMDKWYVNHMAVFDMLRQQNIPYLMVIGPDKQSIYPEYLPYRIRRKAGLTTLDQFSRYAEKMQAKGFIELRSDLRAMKDDGLVYWKSDSHWNERGFLHAYERIIDWLRDYLPDLAPAMTADDFNFTEGQSQGDLAKIIGDKSYFLEPTLSLKIKNKCVRLSHKIELAEYNESLPYRAKYLQCDKEKGRLLFIHDSFGNAVSKPLFEHFAETIDSSRGDAYLLKKLITEFKPDAVVYLRVERELPSLFDSKPELARAYLAQQFESDQNKDSTLNLLRTAINCENCTATRHGDIIDIDALNNDPFLTFSTVIPPALGTTITLKITMVTEQRSSLKVYYTTEEAPEFSENKAVKLRTDAGEQTHYLRIAAGSPFKQLRVDPGTTPGKYSISQLALQSGVLR